MSAEGVFVIKGMKIGFKEGDLSIWYNENGELESKAILSTSLIVTPIWIRNASLSLKKAKEASIALKEIENQKDADQLRNLLLDELGSSLQVIVSCAIAIDSLFELLFPYASITEDIKLTWKRNRTKRSSKIFEVIKRQFKFDNQNAKLFSKAIAHIFNLRDKAMHPSTELQHCYFRKDIQKDVDWKFAFYTYEEAKSCYINTINIFGYFHKYPSIIEESNKIINDILDALLQMNLITIKEN